MTCREVADFLLDYTSGQLAAPVRATFEHHLAVCPDCRAYLAHYVAVVELERDWADDDTRAAAAGVPEDLVAAILASRAI